MENKLLTDMNNCLSQLERNYHTRKDRLLELSDYSQQILKPVKRRNGCIYYGTYKAGEKRIRYIGSDSNPEVKMIKESRYLAEYIKTVEHDISLIKAFLSSYEPVSFGHVNNKLPKTYRLETINTESGSEIAKSWKQNAEAYKSTFEPFMTESLIHRTIDGTMVRSKSEAIIYNYLLENDYTFAYELPVRGANRVFYPDFTILSEIDYKTEVRIEHQGMYSDNDYRERSETREYDYWSNGFLPARDIYFTFDDNRGGFDITPILEILKSRVRVG